MNKETFYRLLDIYIETNNILRRGQAAFNLLYSIKPKETNKYRNTKYDPFYDDNKIEIFVNKILKE